MSEMTLTPVTLKDDGEVWRLLRTPRIDAGRDDRDTGLYVHVEISADPPTGEPDDKLPTVCINKDARPSGDPNDTSWLDIDDPDALDQLIAALTAAAPILRHLRKEAGL